LDHFLVFMVGLFCLNVYCVCFWGWERREVSVIFVCVCLFCVVAVCDELNSAEGEKQTCYL